MVPAAGLRTAAVPAAATGAGSGSGFGSGSDAPGDDMSTKIEQLKQLGDLKAQGVLTEEEFEAQKRNLLAT